MSGGPNLVGASTDSDFDAPQACVNTRKTL
jgi:hypothetical protein